MFPLWLFHRYNISIFCCVFYYFNLVWWSICFMYSFPLVVYLHFTQLISSLFIRQRYYDLIAVMNTFLWRVSKRGPRVSSLHLVYFSKMLSRFYSQVPWLSYLVKISEIDPISHVTGFCYMHTSYLLGFCYTHYALWL